jgi:hypothetical protein
VTTKPEAAAAANATASAVVPAFSADLERQYSSMLATVPDATGGGLDNILEQIATATAADELDDPWESGSLRKLVDTPLVFTEIAKSPSDYTGGLAYFLIVRGAVRATGETFVATTGSVSIVAQLVKAWSLGAFPLAAIPRQAKRPTPDGYFPMHLEIIR